MVGLEHLNFRLRGGDVTTSPPLSLHHLETKTQLCLSILEKKIWHFKIQKIFDIFVTSGFSDHLKKEIKKTAKSKKNSSITQKLCHESFPTNDNN